MESLAFSFYRALFDQLEMYETHFLQLQRDYNREAREETLFFAVDFSELHDYIHSGDRTTINRYILDTLDDQFSILPGAVGELFTDLEKNFPKDFNPQLSNLLLADRDVVQFRSNFTNALQHEEYLIELYSKAETKLRGALGEILDVLVSDHTPAQRLQKLLSAGKLAPIEGVRKIGQLAPDDRDRFELVEHHLNLSRPRKTENNQIDAVDFIITLLLNERGKPSNKRYITIYSQAADLIMACRSHPKLQWEGDYLIREAKYFKFRVKLQEQFSTLSQRQEYLMEGRELCNTLKIEIRQLVDIDAQIQEGAITPSLKFLDLFRKFDEQYRQPLFFREDMEEKTITPERAKQLYETLVAKDKFAGRVEDAYGVLKQHLKRIESEFQVFTPASTDTDDVRRYKSNLRRWLGFEDLQSAEKENPKQTEEDSDDR